MTNDTYSKPSSEAPAVPRTTDSDARWFVNYTNLPGTGRTTAVCQFSTLGAARHFARGKRGYIIRVADGPDGGATFAEFVGDFEPSAQELRRVEALTGRPLPASLAPASGRSAVKGKVGKRYAEGEVVTTVSGSQTTAFPRIATDSDRQLANTLKRAAAWLIENAALEAQRRGDEFNRELFINMDLNSFSQADKDHAEHYLFDAGFFAH